MDIPFKIHNTLHSKHPSIEEVQKAKLIIAAALTQIKDEFLKENGRVVFMKGVSGTTVKAYSDNTKLSEEANKSLIAAMQTIGTI